MSVFYLIFPIAIIVTVSSQNSLLISNERLPGLDDLESGFNFVSMTTTKHTSNGYRIFDLSEIGPNPYRYQVGGIDRYYNTPLHVQVSRIGTRRDVNCESVITEFKQFYSSYFQSIRSRSGFSFFGIGSSTSTHSTLQTIHSAMTKKSQAIGVTTSWWSLYSIQLGPPFLLKFDKFFNYSIQLLAQIGSEPKTESQQSLYNMFINTYGTHYVSNVVVGATAHLYTLFNENYAKTATSVQVSTQVTAVGSFFFISGGGSAITSIGISTISEEFRKNAETITEYRPPVNQIPGKTEFQSWLTAGASNPLAVNKTIGPISDLLYELPYVQSHLKRTIEYYGATGELPTLAQLNNFSAP